MRHQIPSPTHLPRFGDRRRARIGLLGGSFNPAHEGHLHVARTAVARLKLDQIWLMVSPGNPLKTGSPMATLATRLAAATSLADGRRLIATDIEAHLGTRYTIDTLRALRRRFPRAKFVWIIGADNLAQLPSWRSWRDIFAAVPFAVLPRPTYNVRALSGQAASAFRSAKMPARAASILADQSAPAWLFLPARQSAISATKLRSSAEGEFPSPASLPTPPPRNPNVGSRSRP